MVIAPKSRSPPSAVDPSTAASAWRSAPERSAKARNARPTGWVMRAGSSTSSAAARPPSPESVGVAPEVPSGAGDHERLHPGIGRGEAGGDERTHGVSDDLDPFDPERAEDRLCVADHGVAGVRRRIVGCVGCAVAASVGGDDHAAVRHERVDDARLDPVVAVIGGEAVEEQHRAPTVGDLWVHSHVREPGSVEGGDVASRGLRMRRHRTR